MSSALLATALPRTWQGEHGGMCGEGRSATRRAIHGGGWQLYLTLLCVIVCIPGQPLHV